VEDRGPRQRHDQSARYIRRHTAIRQLLSEGINVNVTLLFAQAVYEEVAATFIDGVEKFAATGGDVSKLASVASFFISRIDSLVDSLVGEKLKAETDAARKAKLQGILGKVAIANGKLTYEAYGRIFSSPRWKALAARERRPSACSGRAPAPRIRIIAT